MEKNYADVLESYLIAEEGLGMDILNLVGKGIGVLLKALGILVGLPIAACSLLVFASAIRHKRVQKRLANPTPAEKLSKENYISTWVPKIREFQQSVQADIDKLDKKNGIKKYLAELDLLSDNPNDDGYGAVLVSMIYSRIQYPDAMGDDDPDPEKARDFSKCLAELKPFIQEWKNKAKAFSPYFEIVIDLYDEDETNPWIWVALSCKWIDRDGIIRPGFPKFEEKLL